MDCKVNKAGIEQCAVMFVILVFKEVSYMYVSVNTICVTYMYIIMYVWYILYNFARLSDNIISLEKYARMGTNFCFWELGIWVRRKLIFHCTFRQNSFHCVHVKWQMQKGVQFVLLIEREWTHNRVSTRFHEMHRFIKKNWLTIIKQRAKWKNQIIYFPVQSSTH